MDTVYGLTSKMEVNRPGTMLQRYLPARVVFVILGFFGFNLVYAFKVVVSMSIVAMVNSTATSHEVSGVNECAGTVHISANNQGEFNWDEGQKSLILGAFFYGYVVTQLPAGIFSTKMGGKWMFGTCMFIASLLSLASPWAARYNYRMFVAVRIMQGLAEGVAYPCMNTMIGKWMPWMERSRGTTIIFTGAMLGTVLTLPMTSALGSSSFLGGWPAAYYILGMSGVVWYILWIFFVFETPESHPYISTEEQKFILENGGGTQLIEKSPVPYREMLTSVPVYALIWTNFGQNWAFLTILNLMPTYMNDVLHTTETQNTIISGLPYLGQMLFGWMVSYYTDKVRQSGRYEITTIRKFNSFIAYIPTALFIVLIPQVGCNVWLSCTLFILAVAINGACFSGFNSTHVDMAPDFAGILMGITNSIGNVPGFLATIVASQFTKNKESTVHNWAPVFYIGAAVYVLTAFVYIMWASAMEQPWGTRKRYAEKDSTKI